MCSQLARSGGWLIVLGRLFMLSVDPLNWYRYLYTTKVTLLCWNLISIMMVVVASYILFWVTWTHHPCLPTLSLLPLYDFVDCLHRVRDYISCHLWDLSLYIIITSSVSPLLKISNKIYQNDLSPRSITLSDTKKKQKKKTLD